MQVHYFEWGTDKDEGEISKYSETQEYDGILAAAFSGCTGLEEVTLPSNIKNIRSDVVHLRV